MRGTENIRPVHSDRWLVRMKNIVNMSVDVELRCITG